MPGLRSVLSRDWYEYFTILSCLQQWKCTWLKWPHKQGTKHSKAGGVLGIIPPAWREAYYPFWQISINESVITFKTYYQNVYSPDKPFKWGLKVWVLAESKSGYVYNWQLVVHWKLEWYTGNLATPHPHEMHPIRLTVVYNFCYLTFNKGHFVLMDNFLRPEIYSLNSIATGLVHAYGTIRENHVIT